MIDSGVVKNEVKKIPLIQVIDWATAEEVPEGEEVSSGGEEQRGVDWSTAEEVPEQGVDWTGAEEVPAPGIQNSMTSSAFGIGLGPDAGTDNFTAALDRRTKFIKETWNTAQEAATYSTEMGIAATNGDMAALDEAVSKMEAIPAPEYPAESRFDKIIKPFIELPAQMVNYGAKEAGDEFQHAWNVTVGADAGGVPKAIGATIGNFGYQMMGSAAQEMRKAGVDPDVIKTATNVGSVTIGASSFLPVSRVTELVPKAKDFVAPYFAKGMARAFSAGAVETGAKVMESSALKTAGAAAKHYTGTAVTLGFLELQKAAIEDTGMRLSNALKDTDVKTWDVDYMVDRSMQILKDSMKNAFVLSTAGAGAGAAAGAVRGTLSGARRGIESVGVKHMLRQWEKRQDVPVAKLRETPQGKAIAAEAAPAQKTPYDQLSYEEKLHVRETTDSLVAADDIAADKILADAYVSKAGRVTEVTKNEYRQLKKTRAELVKDLHGRKATEAAAEIPATEETSGLIKDLREARKEAQVSEGPAPKEALDKIESLNKEVYDKTKLLETARDRVKSLEKKLDETGKLTDNEAAELAKTRDTRVRLAKELHGEDYRGVTPAREAKAAVDGLHRERRRVLKAEKDLREQGVKKSDPARQELIAKADALKEEIKGRKAELKDIDERISGIEGRRASDEKLAEHSELVADVKKTGIQNWMEDGNKSEENLDTFKNAIAGLRQKARAARTAGHAEGERAARSKMAQVIAARRLREVQREARKKVIKSINNTVKKGASKKGLTDAATQSLFDGFKRVEKLSPEKKAEFLADGFQPMSVEDGMVRSLLQLKRKAGDMPLDKLVELDKSLSDLFDKGNELRMEGLLADQIRQAEIKKGVIGEILPGVKDVNTALRNREKSTAVDSMKKRRGFRQMAKDFLYAPGYGFIENWRSVGRTLMQDIYKKHVDSALGKLFDVTKQDAMQQGILNKDLRPLQGIFGDTFKLEKDIDVRKLMFKRASTADKVRIVDEAGKPYTIIDRKGNAVPLELTKNERIDLAMILRDARVMEEFKLREGYTDEMIAAIQDLPAEEAMLLRGLDAWYERGHAQANPIFEKAEGRPMPKRDWYAPLIREGLDELETPLSAFLRDETAKYKADAEHSGRLGERSKGIPMGAGKIRVMDAFEKANFYARDMSHYIAWREKMSDLNAVLHDKDVLSAIRMKFGEFVGDDIITEMHNSLNVLGRGYKEFFPKHTITDFMIRNATRATLAAKAMVGAKQLDSTIQYMVDQEGMTPRELSKGLAEFANNPAEAIRIMNKYSTYIKERGLDIDPTFKQDLGGVKPSKFDPDGIIRFYANEASNKLMLPIHLGDKAAIYMGGYSLFRKLLVVDKMRPEEAMLRVESATKNLQQTSELSGLSALQRRQDPLSKVSTAYVSTPFAYMRASMDAVKDLVKASEEVAHQKDVLTELKANGGRVDEITAQAGKLKAARVAAKKLRKNSAKTILLTWVTSGISYTTLSNLGDNDAAETIAGGILGPVSALPVMGYIIESAVRKATGLSPYQNKSIIARPIADIASAIEDIIRPDKEITGKTFRGIASGLQLATPLPTTYGFDVMSSIFTDLPEGEWEKTALKAAGATPNRAERIMSD